MDKSAAHDGTVWAEVLRPLTDIIANSWEDFLPKLVYPIRVGEHTNTAFGLSLALDYTKNTEEFASLDTLIKHNSSEFYLTDKYN